jgi:ATP-dependent protease Clp ATPase subunit
VKDILTVDEIPLVIKHLRTLIRAGLTGHEAVNIISSLLTVDTDPEKGRRHLPVIDEVYRLERQERDALAGDALASAAEAMLAGRYAQARRFFDLSDRLEGRTPLA